MPYPQTSNVTTDGESGSSYTNPGNTTPAPRYPRNRAVASWRPTALRPPPGGYATPVTDGPPASSNPWTSAGAGFQGVSAGSGDPAAGYAGYKPGGGWAGGSFNPSSGTGNSSGGGSVTPSGMPGPTKYNVKYGPWGNKIQESYDGGNMPPGKNGQPLQYDGTKAQPGMRYNFGANDAPPGFYDNGMRDPRSEMFRKAYADKYGAGSPYSIAGGRPDGSKVGYTNDPNMFVTRPRPQFDDLSSYQWGGGAVDPGLTPWDTAAYDNMQNGLADYYGGGYGGGGYGTGGGGK